jgi:bifunctional polynucleotide phosphatase/kinase
MWEYIETVLNGNIKVDRTTSLYVGDMAGRKGDYSSSDLLFAMNLGVNFQVPEVFYNMPNGKAVSNRTSVLMKAVEKNEKVFNGRIFIDEFDKTISQKNKLILEDIKKLLLERQCLIMFVGSPASGKTSYYQENIKNIENQIYLSNDTFNGTPGKFNKEIEKTLRNGINVVIDNTNGTSKVREKYIKIARDINKESGKDIKIIVVKFNTEKEIVLHLNAIRTKLINTCILKGNKDCKHNVPAVAIHSYWKRLEEPNKEKENFDYIFEIEYEPIFNVDGKSGITHQMFIQYL